LIQLLALPISKKVIGQRKSDSRPYLKLTVLVPEDDGGFAAVTQWAPPEIAASISSVPGVYEAATVSRVRGGHLVSELVGASLLKAGFP
jgi:hypothetical protein